MPRRRKRNDSSTHRKPPLVFVESPVYGERILGSPVFCADRPIHAQVVQLDESTAIPWVSPQFRGKQLEVDHGKTRRARGPHKASGPTLRTRNPSKDQQHALPKGIVPLDFVGDPKDRQISSPLDDVTIEDHDTGDDDAIYGVRNRRTTPKTKSGVNMSKYIEANGNIIPSIGLIKTRSKSKQDKVGGKDNDSGLRGDSPRLDNKGGKSHNDRCSLPLNGSYMAEDFSSVLSPGVASPVLTQLRPRNTLRQPSKCLFNAIDVNASPGHNVSIPDTPYAINEADHSHERINVQDPFDESNTPRRSLRLQEKYKKLFSKELGSPHTPSQKASLNILARDTPEMHQGLSYREKQLLGIMDM